MTTTFTSFTAQVDYLISADDNELSSAARDEMVKAAIERYSTDRPDDVTADVTGDGGRYYVIPTILTSWSEGFSRIVSIEYPAAVIASDEVPVYLDPEDWDDNYKSGSTRYLFLPNHSPAATETMRIKYTAPYVLSANAYDTPPGDFFAICNLAAGLACQAIAAKYSRTTDSTISADSVDHLTRAQEFSRRSREFIAMYNEHIGLGGDSDGAGGKVLPAGEFVDWDTAPGRNRQWLTHRNR